MMQVNTYSNLEVASSHRDLPKFLSPSELNDQPEVVALLPHKEPLPEVAATSLPEVSEQPSPASEHNVRRRRRIWLIWGILICVLVVAAVVGGVLGGVLPKRRTSSASKPDDASPSQTTAAATATNAAVMSGTAVALMSYSYPTAVSWGSPHLEVFALNSGSYPYRKYRISTASPADQQWNPQNATFEWVGGAAVPYQFAVAATIREPQHVDIFLIGDDFGLWNKNHSGDLKWQPDVTNWESQGGILSSAPSVVSWSSQRLDVFGIGEAPAYQLFQKTWDESSGGWSGWIEHPGGSMSTYTPAAVSWSPGRLDVFAVGANDHALYYRYYYGKQWHPQDSLLNLGGYGTSRPVAISLQQGRIDVFMRGGDAGIWQKVLYLNATWSDWMKLDVGVDVQTEPSIVSCVEGVIDLFAWATDDSLIHKRLNVSTATWIPATGNDKLREGLAGPPSTVSDDVGSLHLFAYTQDGSLGHLSWEETSQTWSPNTGFESLGTGDWH